MTKSTITRARLQELAAGQSGFNLRTATHEESQELARITLDAMDSEPVAWLAIYHGEVYDEAIGITRSVVEAQADHFGWESALTEIIPLYATPQPAPELTATVERLNASGYEYEGGEVTPQNVAAVVDILLKQLDDAVQGRDTQPAPVVTFYRDGIEAAAKWIDQQREAYDSEHGRHDLDTASFEFGNDAQREYSSTLEELAEGIRALHPNAGNSPAIPDGYVMVPVKPTMEILDEFDSIIFYGAEDSEVAWRRLLAAAPQEVK